MSDINLLTKQQYISLETFRKTGTAVRTPVWFVLDGATIYVRTEADSGKAKRIRRSGKINVAACKGNGAITGAWQPADAREIAEPEMVRKVNQMLDKKYGLFKKVFELFTSARHLKPTVLEIKLT